MIIFRSWIIIIIPHHESLKIQWASMGTLLYFTSSCDKTKKRCWPFLLPAITVQSFSRALPTLLPSPNSHTDNMLEQRNHRLVDPVFPRDHPKTISYSLAFEIHVQLKLLPTCSAEPTTTPCQTSEMSRMEWLEATSTGIARKIVQVEGLATEAKSQCKGGCEC